MSVPGVNENYMNRTGRLRLNFNGSNSNSSNSNSTTSNNLPHANMSDDSDGNSNDYHSYSTSSITPNQRVFSYGLNPNIDCELSELGFLKLEQKLHEIGVSIIDLEQDRKHFKLYDPNHSNLGKLDVYSYESECRIGFRINFTNKELGELIKNKLYEFGDSLFEGGGKRRTHKNSKKTKKSKKNKKSKKSKKIRKH
jgi:hypothetical protein